MGISALGTNCNRQHPFATLSFLMSSENLGNPCPMDGSGMTRLQEYLLQGMTVVVHSEKLFSNNLGRSHFHCLLTGLRARINKYPWEYKSNSIWLF
jgi:hypothetical protein